MERSATHIIVLHPGSDIELTMHVTKEDSGALRIRADLSGAAAVSGQSRIERGKYRAFSNAVHTAVYAAPQSGVRVKTAYSISTDDMTGEVVCTIPSASSAEAAAVLDYLAVAPSRATPVRYPAAQAGA